MGYPTKIATCCYCGTRAALILKGAVRHELACSTCGAPLHDLKMLRKDANGDRELVRPLRPRLPKSPRSDFSRKADEKRQSKPKKRKHRKSMFKWLIEEAFDVIEDVFD